MGMEALADLARSDRIGQQLMPMVTAYRAWITQQPKQPISDNEQNETAKQLRAQAEDCAKRIENGIKVLAGKGTASAQCLQCEGLTRSDWTCSKHPNPQLALFSAGLCADEPAGAGNS
jgi:hypothetical protein